MRQFLAETDGEDPSALSSSLVLNKFVVWALSSAHWLHKEGVDQVCCDSRAYWFRMMIVEIQKRVFDVLGVTRDDFLALNEFFRYPVLMKLAFKNYHKSGFKVSRKVFQMNAKNIAGVDLR